MKIQSLAKLITFRYSFVNRGGSPCKVIWAHLSVTLSTVGTGKSLLRLVLAGLSNEIYRRGRKCSGMESPSENANGSGGRLCSRKTLCHPWCPAVPLSAPCKHQAKFPLQSCRSQPFRAKVIESNSHNVTMPLPTEMTSRYKRKHLIFIFISNASISLWYKRKHSGQKKSSSPVNSCTSTVYFSPESLQ